MFIFTTKFNKSRVIAVLLALAMIIAVIVILTSGNDGNSVTAGNLSVKSNEDRVKFLQGYGWEVNEVPIEQQDVIIPQTFSQVYAEYNSLQESQGFDLTEYAGLEATRYTYEVLNYPGVDSQVVADIIVCKNKVIAGDIQCISLDGFMSGLSFPK